MMSVKSYEKFAALMNQARRQQECLVSCVEDDNQAIAIGSIQLHNICMRDVLKASDHLAATIEKILNLVQPSLATA